MHSEVTESLPAAGTAETWSFVVQYVYYNAPFGQMSRPVSITVRGQGKRICGRRCVGRVDPGRPGPGGLTKIWTAHARCRILTPQFSLFQSIPCRSTNPLVS